MELSRKEREARNKLVGCAVCGGPRTGRRIKYCSDECYQTAHAKQTRAIRDTQLQACSRCGAPKTPGRRGGRLCDACLEVQEDVARQLERERHRRNRLAEVEAKLAAGEAVAFHPIPYKDGEKWCPRCQEYRPEASFPSRKNGTKKATYCRPCQKAYNVERRLKIQFGMDWDDYEFLLGAQDGRCAICGGRPRKHMLAVDHDHGTGEIRGLLCSRCNHRLLGAANDSAERLRKAADYLEAFTPREVFGEPRYVPGSRGDK